MPYKKEQRPTGQSYSGVWDPGKAGRQRQTQVGQRWLSLATLLSPAQHLSSFSKLILRQGKIWAAAGMACAFSANTTLRIPWPMRPTDLTPLETRSQTG